MNWFYESAGQQQGPVSDYDLDRLLSEGKITGDTLVWREGQAEWQPLRVVRPAAGAEDEPGLQRCASCARTFPVADLAQIGGRPICPECKPGVLLGLQQGLALPGAGEDERTGPAWEHRETLGLFPALWQTIRMVLIEPGQTFSHMRRTGGLMRPLVFYWILATPAAIFENCLVGLYRMRFPSPELAGAPPFALIFSTAQFNFYMAALAPFMALIAPFLGAGIIHVCLLICRGARQPFETTFRTYCYGTGAAAALQFIPVCGAVVGGVWALVVQCIGLSRSHEIGVGRAVLAIFLPIILCCVVIFIGAMVVGFTTAAALNHR